jgi:hypothetical protein
MTELERLGNDKSSAATAYRGRFYDQFIQRYGQRSAVQRRHGTSM